MGLSVLNPSKQALRIKLLPLWFAVQTKRKTSGKLTKHTDLDLSFRTRQVPQLGRRCQHQCPLLKGPSGPCLEACSSAQWRLSELRIMGTQFLSSTEQSPHRWPRPRGFGHLLCAGGNLGCLAHSLARSQSKASIDEDGGVLFHSKAVP